MGRNLPLAAVAMAVVKSLAMDDKSPRTAEVVTAAKRPLSNARNLATAAIPPTAVKSTRPTEVTAVRSLRTPTTRRRSTTVARRATTLTMTRSTVARSRIMKTAMRKRSTEGATRGRRVVILMIVTWPMVAVATTGEVVAATAVARAMAEVVAMVAAAAMAKGTTSTRRLRQVVQGLRRKGASQVWRMLVLRG